MILVPDTSVLIDGRITSMIKAGEYKGATIIVPEAVVAELEAQANNGREIGFSGLNQSQSLCKMAEEKTIELKFSGIRPTLEQVRLASGGEIDAMIRNIAIENAARFITSDNVQAEVARAKGLDVIYLKPQVTDFVPLGIDQFFDEHTIAVYLKERVPPTAKKGTINDMKLVKIRDQPVSEYKLRNLAQEILERAKRDPDGFIEIEKRGITVVQIGSLRIAIARRPFSDGMEITAVRPIVDVTLDNYAKSDVIKKRIVSDRRGLIIAGSPAQERPRSPKGSRRTSPMQAMSSRPWKRLANSRCPTRSRSTPRLTAACPTPPTSSCSSARTSSSSMNCGRTRISQSLPTCGLPASAWSGSSTPTVCRTRSSASPTARTFPSSPRSSTPSSSLKKASSRRSTMSASLSRCPRAWEARCTSGP